MKSDHNNVGSPIDSDHVLHCVACSKELTGKQRKYCSNACKCKISNSYHQIYSAQKKRGLKRKLELISLFGGGCSSCGYSKNSAALCFHHINSSDKSFELSLRECSNYSWTKVMAEARKCSLLCANCHLELHNPQCFI